MILVIPLEKHSRKEVCAFGPEPGLQSSKEKYVVIRSTATITTIRDLIDRVSLRVH
jgi:hypothetical protein